MGFPMTIDRVIGRNRLGNNPALMNVSLYAVKGPGG